MTTAQEALEQLRQENAPTAQQKLDELRAAAESPEEQKSTQQINPLAYGAPLKDRMYAIGGLLDVVKTGASAGVAEIFSGFAGIGALLLSKGDVDHASKRVRAWQDTITTDMWTDTGTQALESVAPFFSKASVKVSDFAEKKATDETGYMNPAVATLIETGIWGSMDIVGAIIPSIKTSISAAKLAKLRKAVIKDAERLGINLHLDDFADDVLDAAKRLGSDFKGEEALEYVTALRNAEYLARLKKRSLYLAARDTDLYVATTPVRRMGRELGDQLFEEGFDLDGDHMGAVRKALDDMSNKRLGFGSGQGLAVHFSRFEILRKRLNRKINSPANAGEARAALTRIRDEMDGFITTEYNKALIENGRVISEGGTLSGDVEGLTTYLAARKANVEWNWFKENKIIADLISKDTTPEQFSQWLIGATAVGAKKEAAAIVRKMKQLLGDDHPAIDAVRLDFIYELTEPLLQLDPNFKQFAANYDKLVRKNSSLMNELGITGSDLELLADFANVARHLPRSGHLLSPKEIITTISRLGVGHGVAKGAARVMFANKTLGMITGVDAITKNQLIDAVINVGQKGSRYQVSNTAPLIPSKSVMGASLIAGAAISGMMDENE